MPNLKNYGTLENPIWMTDPPQTADGTTTTPYNRYDQAHVSEANMIKEIQETLSDGTVGNRAFFGTGLSGTEGDISYTVAGSKANDTYTNTSSFNFYVAKAANLWNYQGNLKGPKGDDGQDGEDGQDGQDGQDGDDGQDGVGSGWTGSTDSSSTSCSWTLANGTYKYFSNAAVSSLTITDGLSNLGDVATVEFTSPSTAATYSAPSGSKHYGDDCTDGAFTPAASTTYKLVFEKWGAGLTCYVKARS